MRRKLGILILVFLFLGSISGCSGTGNETIPVETFPEEPNSYPSNTDFESVFDNTSQTGDEFPILTEPSFEGTTEIPYRKHPACGNRRFHTTAGTYRQN